MSHTDKARHHTIWNRCRPWLWQILIPFLILSSQPTCDRRADQSGASPASSSAALLPLTNMVHIKAATYIRIKDPVTLTRDFWIGKYEVTQGEYEAVMRKNPSHFLGDANRPVEKLTYF